ncbi:MAG: S8 family serine peptidase [Sedimentisphaerales bacterium]|nr:S8 family serine peptidase [Sedimentisphaerales bacterium]
MSRFLSLIMVFVLCCTAAALASLQPAGLEVAGVYKLASLDPNLTGEGVNIGVVCRSNTYIDSEPQNDYRPDISHNSLEDVKIRFHDDQDSREAGVSSHSTAIASILAGFDPDASFEPIGDFAYQGACPDAGLDIYEFRHFLVKYVFSGVWPEADLLTMSLGWSIENWWTRGVDKMAESFGILIIAAIGNGTDGHDLSLYPAAGSNILAVGVADSSGSLSKFTAPDANHSSSGPTLDGRCKPDIVAPGNCLIAVGDSKEAYRPCGDYSSFAVPVVAGVACQLVQKAKSDPNLQMTIFPFVGNCVMKSILLTSAEKLSGWHKGGSTSGDDHEHPLDFKQGAGMVDAPAAYKVLTAGIQNGGAVKAIGWDSDAIEPNYIAEKVYRFKTDITEKTHLSSTLVWNKSYENSYPFEPQQSQADLRLELWTIDAAGGNKLVDYSDSPVDNVEHLYVELDPNTEYQLVISNSLNADLPASFTSYAVSWQRR